MILCFIITIDLILNKITHSSVNSKLDFLESWNCPLGIKLFDFSGFKNSTTELSV